MNSTPQNTQLIKQKRDVRDLVNSESFKAEIAKVLPKHLTPERMTRVALTAFLKTPQLLSCSPESLTNALLICSQIGLEPDGRLLHLIPFGNAVTVIIDWKGLVALALRNGFETIYGDQVCEADEFTAGVVNGRKMISHNINYKQARGDAYCFYAVAIRNGVVDFEVMTKEECDAIRARSKAGRSGPWVTDYSEMCKKTVLRRMSKRWDLLPEIADAIAADDDVPAEVRAPLMKPVFETPATSIGQPGEPEIRSVGLPPDATAPSDAIAFGPEATAQAPVQAAVSKPEKTVINYVKAVRNLCKMSSITEGKLLEFLAEIGSTDGSVSTLEELAMYQGGETLKLAHDQWAGETGIAAKIKAVKEIE